MSVPRVTLIVLCYRQEDFVRDAVASALAQSGPPIEIIISDDASPDGTWDVIRALTSAYRGHHLVKTHRNEKNIGLIEHFEQTLRRSSGEVIVYLAGDDIAVPNRVAVAVDILDRHPTVNFIESASKVFRSEAPGDLEPVTVSPDHAEIFDLDDFVSGHSPALSSATRAFRKAPLLAFPPLSPILSSEDSPNALRLLMQGQGLCLREALLYKRAHEDNITNAAGLMRIDFDQIRRQYVDDIRHACGAKLITTAKAKTLEEWAFRNIETRKLRRIIDLRHPRLRELALLILPSQYLGVRAKIYAIRRFFAGLLVKSG